jgi:formyltetrahydrofolate hydrolase
MQTVTSRLIEPYRNRLINIHHAMLPAFWGHDRTSRRATVASD